MPSEVAGFGFGELYFLGSSRYRTLRSDSYNGPTEKGRCGLPTSHAAFRKSRIFEGEGTYDMRPRCSSLESPFQCSVFLFRTCPDIV